MSKLDKMKDKIAKLLAKAERTDNEHEAETFTASAHKLMLAYGIELAELESAGEVKPEEIVEVYRPLAQHLTSRSIGASLPVDRLGPENAFSAASAGIASSLAPAHRSGRIPPEPSSPPAPIG